MRDLAFVAGDFLWRDLPYDKEFYGFYFQTEMERNFLSYYFIFRDMYRDEGMDRFWNNFIDHTGYRITKRWIFKLIKRFNAIENGLQKAYETIMSSSVTSEERTSAMQVIADIKSGRSGIL